MMTGLKGLAAVSAAALLILAAALPAAANPTVVPAPIGEVQEARSDRTVAVSDDGRYVVFDAAPTMTLTRSFWVDSATGEQHQLTEFFRYLAADVSSDGDQVLMHGYLADDVRDRLEVLNPRDGSSTLVALEDEWAGGLALHSPRFVAGDTRVIFGVITDTDVEIVRRTISSGATTTYPSMPNGWRVIEFSRDGRYALVTDGNNSIFRRTVATGANELIVVASIVGAAISSDGRFVVVDEMLYDLVAGSSLQFVGSVDKNGIDPGGYSAVDVSDDGSVVAFATSEPLSASDTNNRTDVYVWRRSGTASQRISLSDVGTQLGGPSSGVHLTPDGSVAIVQSQSVGVAATVSGQAGVGAALIRVELDTLPTEGIVDVALVPGGGILRLDRAGAVSASAGAVAYGDCVDGPGRLLLDPGESASSISPTPSGDGYWIFTDRGRAFACGAATSFGDLGDIALDGPVVDSIATVTGLGYYMVAADGGLFAFGDAVYRGSVPQVLPGVPLAAPVVAISVTDSNGGYRMLAADGGMFNFGDADFHGSIPEVLPGVPLAGSVVGMVASPRGYLMVATDGGIFNFGESVFHGSLGDNPPPTPIGSVVVVPDLSGYVMFDESGVAYPFGTGSSIL